MAGRRFHLTVRPREEDVMTIRPRSMTSRPIEPRIQLDDRLESPRKLLRAQPVSGSQARRIERGEHRGHQADHDGDASR